MVWNFHFTIPSFIVLLFFVIYYFLRPNLLVKSNKYFLLLVVFEVLGFFSDIISSYSDGISVNYYRSFLVIVDGIYFILFIIRHYIVSLFFASLLKIRVRKNIPTIITTFLVFTVLLLIIANPISQFLYKVDEFGKYFRAKGICCIYLVSFMTLALDLYYILSNRKKLQITELVSSLFCVIALIAGNLIKIFFVHYLLMDMFFLFVIVSLFLAFENPEVYLEKKTNLYNKLAFNDVISEHFFRKEKIAIITFCIKNYSEKREIYGSKQMDAALKVIGKYFLSNFKNFKIFYLRNGRFSFVSNNCDIFPNLRKKVKERFKQPWEVLNSQLHLNIAVIEMNSDVKLQSKEEVYASFRIAFQEVNDAIDDYILIDKTYFDRIAYTTKVSKALNKALLTDELQLYLQPIVDSKTRKIIAAEALVRLYDQELGLVPPVEFITMAEKNGSIEQLGNQVLNKVCSFIKETSITNYGIKWINVNLSPIECQNNNLPENIDRIIDNYKVLHNNIHLEITEDSMIDQQVLKRQMNILITDGYEFSLDDFGTGFSNITRVKNYPFNNIKLDMSIVRDHFNSPDNVLPSIVQAFIGRGLSVTAEGVETKEMADELEKMGCDYLQGYFFSKPIPCKDFEQLLKENII